MEEKKSFYKRLDTGYCIGSSRIHQSSCICIYVVMCLAHTCPTGARKVAVLTPMTYWPERRHQSSEDSVGRRTLSKHSHQ